MIGYYEKGFSLYDKKTKRLQHFTKSDGLISNSTRDALQTKDGIVWIITGNGISRFNPYTKEFINYSYEDGIIANDFESITELPDGRIAAGSTKGVVVFSPDRITWQKKNTDALHYRNQSLWP